MAGPRVFRRFSAGVVDSASAASASFVAGLVAIWVFTTDELGVYAVFLSALLMATHLIRHFVFIPIEMEAVRKLRSDRRNALVPQSLRLGLWPALGGASVTALAALFTLGLAGPDLIVPLTVTSVAVTVVSPYQDHLRRMLHLSERSARAGVVSLLHLVIVGLQAILFIGPLAIMEVDASWLPFGILVTANVVSLIAGWLLSRSHQPLSIPRLRLGELSVPGRWLASSAVATKGSIFLASALISHLAGTDVLGYAEAARVAAQPLAVLGIGLQDSMSPRLMQAGNVGDAEVALRWERRYLTIYLSLGSLYLLFGSFDWAINPMSHLVPEAYEVTGLVAASIAAVLVASSVYPYRLELLGGRAHRNLSVVDVLSSIGPVVAAFASPLLLSFARPVGLASQGMVQLYGYRQAQSSLYRGQWREGVGYSASSEGDHLSL